MIGHGARSAELFEQVLHGQGLCDCFVQNATNKSHCICANISRQGRMSSTEPIAIRLKRLRESTEPKLTVRATAEILGVPTSTYAAYEDPKKFKKSYLPMTITKSIADAFVVHGIPKEEVLALAGLDAAGAIAPRPDEIAEQLDAVLLAEVEVSWSMGGGSEIDERPVVRTVPFSRAWLRGLTNSPPDRLIVARGDGDSMMPTILDQDLCIIDLDDVVPRQQDRIWALAYGSLGMIKRLRSLPNGSLQINSDNAAVSPIVASDGEAHIVGRVVGIIRRI